MELVAVAQPTPASPRPVAPARHTVVLIAVFAILALAGARFGETATAGPSQVARHPDVTPLYLGLIAMEWGLLLYVSRAGLKATGTRLRDLIGERWSSAGAVLRDAAIALGLWGGWMLLDYSLGLVSGPGRAASIAPLLPRGVFESTLWVVVSMSAGFCEEIVFRGYFQRQFEAWTGSAGLACLLQAALFGISHGYQGIEACLKIVLFGLLFGMVALWRKSLRPGIAAHAITDIAAGLFRP